MHEGPRVKSSGSSENCQDAGVKFCRCQVAQSHIAHPGAPGANFLASEKSDPDKKPNLTNLTPPNGRLVAGERQQLEALLAGDSTHLVEVRA